MIQRLFSHTCISCIKIPVYALKGTGKVKIFPLVRVSNNLLCPAQPEMYSWKFQQDLLC